MKIEGNTTIKVYIKVLLNSLIFLFIAALFAQSANAALQAVGPNDQFGFAAWYSDANGLALEPCLGNATNFDDVYCVLGAGENPALPLVLSGPPGTNNFPDEFFYYIADIGPVPAGTLPAGVKFRMVLEGAFATPVTPITCPLGGCPAVGQQITFLRINMQPAITGLVPNATYILTYPFGQVTLQADATGTLGRFRLEDSSFIPGDFASVLPGTLTRIGPFLTQVGMPPGGFVGVSLNNPTGRYISQSSVVATTITPGPFGNFFRITGPNIGGSPGVNTIQDNQWFLAGRFFPGAANINGFKINDDNANGVQDAGELRIPNWNITLTGLDTGVVKTTTTNATGFYEFAQMLPGNYTITEELKPGFANTTPISRTFLLLDGIDRRENFTNLLVRHGVTISVVPPTTKTTTLGVQATYTILVNNTGNLADTFTLTPTVPVNAVVTLNQQIITIPALGSVPVTLGVTSDTAVGIFTVPVTATSEGDRTVTATTVPGTTTEVLGIIVTPRIAMLKPGESMTFTASETVNITFSATSGIIVPGAVPGTAVFTAGATGEVTISATNTTITPTPVGATGTATVFVGANRSTSQALVTGYNQVILPVQPPAVTFTASKLLQLVKAQTTAQGLNVDALKVVRWNDAAQKFEAFDPAAGVAGTDFAIEGGKVYFIRMSGPGAVVSIVGTITGIS